MHALTPLKLQRKCAHHRKKKEKKKDPGTKDCKSFLSPNISSIPHTAALENSSAYTEILPQIVCLDVNEQKALSLDVALQGLLRRLIKCL